MLISHWTTLADAGFGAEDYLEAIASATRYLELAGRDSEQYGAALELLDRAIALGCTPERMTDTLASVRACLAAGAESERGGRGRQDYAGLGGGTGGSCNHGGADGGGRGSGGGG